MGLHALTHEAFMDVVKADVFDRSDEGSAEALRMDVSSINEWRDALMELLTSVSGNIENITAMRDAAPIDGRASLDEARRSAVHFKKRIEMRLSESRRLLAELSDSGRSARDEVLVEIRDELRKISAKLGA